MWLIAQEDFVLFLLLLLILLLLHLKQSAEENIWT
jgi:hypothetical protein